MCLFLLLPNLFYYYSLDAYLFSNNPNRVLISMGGKVGDISEKLGKGKL